MKIPNPHLLASGVAAAVALAALPVWAESIGSAASSASSAGSASLASLSDSVQGSSRSSGGQGQVAQGDYRVVQVVLLDDGSQRLELQLRRLASDGADTGDDPQDAVRVRVARAALGARGMTAGDIVHVSHRPYGLEFARTGSSGGREPFLLALSEPWQRELSSRPLGL